MGNKILFVSIMMTGGGAERVVSILSDSLVKRGYDVGVFIYYRDENEYKLNENVKVYTFPPSLNIHSKNPLVRISSRYRYIRKFIARYKPDCCIPFLEGITKEVFFATFGLNIPIIATVRNIPTDRTFLDKLTRNFVYKRTKGVFLQTEEQKKFFPDEIQNKSFVVGNPINEAMLENGVGRIYRDRITTVVTLGRLDPQKNQNMLIDAMCEVHKKYPDVVLKIYGSGPEEENLIKKIKQSDAEEFVTLEGRTNNVKEVLKNADMFVLSSDYEGMPNALMEAMASGLPCVSTECPTGPGDLIGKNERGMLVPVKNSKAMSNAISELLEDPKRASEYGRMAHEYISANFQVDTITDMLLENLKKYCVEFD